MIFPVTFEIYPPHQVICSSRFGCEPCAPPLLLIPDQRALLLEESLISIVRHEPILSSAPALAERAWRVRAGCSFSPCPYHDRNTIYLSATIEPSDLADLIPALTAKGWLRNGDAAAYNV